MSGGLGDDSVRAGIVKTVYLDFDSATDTTEREYSSDEREATKRILEQDYAAFDIEFMLQRPFQGPFVTVLFNETPFINGRFHAGGVSEGIGWRTLQLGGTVIVDVSGFFGFGIPETRVQRPLSVHEQAPDGSDGKNNFVELSATIAAHELAHFYGLRHHDAMGPIGYGLFEELGVDRFTPTYPIVVPTAAVETADHLSASPASIGTTLADALNGPFLGEREAIKLAFADTGTIVEEASAAATTITVSINEDGDSSTLPVTIEANHLGQLPQLTVPNTLQAEAVNSEDQFDVQAIDIVGSIPKPALGDVSESDFFVFEARRGFLTVEVLSVSLRDRLGTDTIDSMLRIFDVTTGEKLDFYGSRFGAFNDDGIENQDSLLLDVPILVPGIYMVEVDTFSFAAPEFPDYAPPGFDADALCDANPTVDPCADTDSGQYELLIYQFNTTERPIPGSGDVVAGGEGADTLIGSTGLDQFPDAGPEDEIVDKSDIRLGLQVHTTEQLQINEGELANVVATFQNLYPLATHSATVQWGDGTIETSPSVDELLQRVTAAHRYVDDGIFQGHIHVVDNFSVAGRDDFTVIVNNVSPNIDSLNVPETAFEGQVVALSATASDPGMDPLTYLWRITAPDGSTHERTTADATFTPADDGTYSIELTVTDDFPESISTQRQVVVQNVDPQIQTISVPTNGQPGSVLSLSATAVDPAGVNDPLTYRWIIEQPDATVIAIDGQTVLFTPTQPGHHDATLVVTDDDGGSASESRLLDVAFITGAQVFDGVLQIIGTEDRDTILIVQSGDQFNVIANFLENGISSFPVADVESIRAFGADGNDFIITLATKVPTMLDGGTGDDRLTGSYGNDTLIGGDGNDVLRGGKGADLLLGGDGGDELWGQQGNDLLVGGPGADLLSGDGGDDVLIGGTTVFDTNRPALDQIMAEWTSANGYIERINQLTGTGPGPRLNGVSPSAGVPVTVFDDNETDRLAGSHGRDWFFADVDRLDDDDDLLQDLREDEVVNPVTDQILDEL